MTSEPSYREKGRAVFLAAIMIVSVVAMSAAFAGSAAATPDGNVVIDDIDAPATVDVDDQGTVTVEIDNTEDAAHDVYAHIEIGGETVEADDGVEYDGSGAAEVALAAEGDDSITYTDVIDEDSPGDVNIDVELWETAGDDGSDFDTDSETVTVEDPDAFDEEQAYDDAGPVWIDEAGDNAYIGQEITIMSEEFADDEGPDNDDVSAVILYEGPASLSGDDRTHEASIEIQEDDDHPHPYGTFETDELEPGEAYHFHVDEDEDTYDFHGDEFWTAEEDLAVDFGVNTVPQDDDADIEFATDRDDMFVNVTSEDFDGDDLEEYVIDEGDFTNVEAYDDDALTLEGVDDGDALELEFEDVEPDVYEFEFESTDSLAWDNATIEVTDEDTAVHFGEDPIGQQGDMVEIVIEPDHTETGVVQVGDYDEENYQSTVEFDIDTPDADEIGLLFDTNDPHDPWTKPEEYQDEYDLTIENDPEDDTFVGWEEDDDNYVLGIYDYEMTAGTEYEEDADDTPDGYVGAVDSEHETDTTFLSVTEPETISDMVLERAPHDTGFDDAEDLEEAYEDDLLTDGTEAAYGDELVLTLEDFGMSGLIEGSADSEDVFEDTAGINITIEEEDPGPNQDAAWWTTYEGVENLDDYEASADEGDVEGIELSNVISDIEEYDDDLVLVIDYDDYDMPGDRSSETSGLDYGEYDLTFEATDDSIFVDDDEDAIEFETNFELEEPEVDLLPENDEVPNSDSAEVTGITNVAPGNDIDTDANSPGNFTDAADAVVQDDGTFTAVYDFSEYDAGTPFEIEAETDENAYDDHEGDNGDDMDSILVDAGDPLISLNADAPGEVEPGDAAALDVTVSNDGGASDDVDITVTIDGEDEEDTTVTLDADGDTWSESFDFDTAEEGDINWDVTAGDNSDSGTLTVAEEEEVVDDDDDETDDDETDDDEDGTPGFGVAVAVVALLAAAMLALRRQD
ncbi:BGTF surface domain-containing protein [Natronobacterium texcoconense]|uniref:PGF-CTERM protein/surface glycoprotein n=1 Tax=Natronobacterium texcoconense TaxID=1095778 RepID=A0A1H1GGB0_NATTX|nr:BGTF surface domain-containing protein [Natronobacterium texcoconense]SDR12175.1 PGF-CTERM protein/surface glycoprotein [Natronobacterium texcoconense]